MNRNACFMPFHPFCNIADPISNALHNFCQVQDTSYLYLRYAAKLWYLVILLHFSQNKSKLCKKYYLLILIFLGYEVRTRKEITLFMI